MRTYFERKAYGEMLAWWRDRAPGYALFLRGHGGWERPRSPRSWEGGSITPTSSCASTKRSRRSRTSSSTLKETRKTVMEVDYLARRGEKVCPVEVKSSGSRSVRSLTKFCDKFGRRIGCAYVLHAGEVRRDAVATYLPYYMAPLL